MIYAGTKLDIPKVGSQWRHANGNLYTIIAIANEHSTEQDKYPATVVYEGEDGKIWSRPLTRWYSSMAYIRATELPAIGTQLVDAERNETFRVTSVVENYARYEGDPNRPVSCKEVHAVTPTGAQYIFPLSMWMTTKDPIAK